MRPDEKDAGSAAPVDLGWPWWKPYPGSISILGGQGDFAPPILVSAGSFGVDELLVPVGWISFICWLLGQRSIVKSSLDVRLSVDLEPGEVASFSLQNPYLGMMPRHRADLFMPEWIGFDDATTDRVRRDDQYLRDVTVESFVVLYHDVLVAGACGLMRDTSSVTAMRPQIVHWFPRRFVRCLLVGNAAISMTIRNGSPAKASFGLRLTGRVDMPPPWFER